MRAPPCNSGSRLGASYTEVNAYRHALKCFALSPRVYSQHGSALLNGQAPENLCNLIADDSVDLFLNGT